jgi:hypothetical protein
MTGSKIYLGTALAYETEVRRAVGERLRDLHVAAQRVAWGVLMGERLGIDLEREVVPLVERFADEPAAHATIAVARAAQGRTDEMRRHIAEARERVSSSHPWAGMIAALDKLTTEGADLDLVEEEPGRCYRIYAAQALPGIPSANPNVATLLRMRSGELVCINPVAIDAALADRIRALGDLTHIIAPAKYHSEQVARVKALFPRARAWGVPAHRRYPGVRSVPFDGFLSDEAPLFPGELDQITMRGVDVGDVWLVDRASRTLIVTDAVFFTESIPGVDRYRTPFSQFYCWAWGVHDRVGIPSYQPPMWSDIRAYQASLRAALERDFDHIASCHGGWRCTRVGGKEALRNGVGWLLELDRTRALGLRGEFVRRHPRVFYRFARAQIVAAFS